MKKYSKKLKLLFLKIESVDKIDNILKLLIPLFFKISFPLSFK